MNVGDPNGPNAALRAREAAQRGDKAYQTAKKEGMGGYAIDFWDGAAKDS